MIGEPNDIQQPKTAACPCRVDRLVGRLLGCGSFENLSDAEQLSIRWLTVNRLLIEVFGNRTENEVELRRTRSHVFQ